MDLHKYNIYKCIKSLPIIRALLSYFFVQKLTVLQKLSCEIDCSKQEGQINMKPN